MTKLNQALVGLTARRLSEIARNATAERFDGWENDVTGFGTSRDKTTYTAFGGYCLLNDQALSNLYHGDDLAARVVDIVPDEMLREGFEVDVGDTSENAAIADALEQLEARKKFANGIRWGRLHGGAALLIGSDDGRSAAAPLIAERARGIQYLYEVDRRHLYPLTWYTEFGHPKLGQPETYFVSPTGVITSGELTIVHETRLILFGGAPTGLWEKARNLGWDHSILQRVYEALRAFNTGFKAVEVMLTDGNQAVYKLQGLAAMIGAQGEELLRARLQAMDMVRSVLRALVLDAGDPDTGNGAEDIERLAVSFEQIPAVIDKFMLRLAAAAPAPVTLLFGQSPAGMNATGESDFRWFYDRIRSKQNLDLAPQIRRLVTVMRRTKAGAASTASNPIKIKFPALWKEAPSVEATRRAALAKADCDYVTAKILTPDEVALSRFGQGSAYGEDIVLTTEAIKIREERILDDLKDPEPVVDDAQEPPPNGPEGVRTDAAELIDHFAHSSRVIVAGGPRTGKSTLAVRAGERHQLPVRHADSLVGVKQWSDASEEVARWFDETTPWIIEGVSTPRAIRKWLAANPGKKMDATVIYLRDPIQVRSKGQVAMAKGVHTVWREIQPELKARGVQIVERDQ